MPLMQTAKSGQKCSKTAKADCHSAAGVMFVYIHFEARLTGDRLEAGD
jgi:hypothetical protein